MTFTNVDEGYGWRTFSDTMSIAPDLSATSRFSEGKRFAYLRDFAWLFGFTWIYYVSFLHPPSFGCLPHWCPTCCRDSTKSWHVRHRWPVMPCQVEHADKPERLDACLSGHRCKTPKIWELCFGSSKGPLWYFVIKKWFWSFRFGLLLIPLRCLVTCGWIVAETFNEFEHLSE